MVVRASPLCYELNFVRSVKKSRYRMKYTQKTASDVKFC